MEVADTYYKPIILKFCIVNRFVSEALTYWYCNAVSCFQSINQNLYSAPSRSLLRGAPDPSQVEKNSLEKVVELKTGTIWEVP